MDNDSLPAAYESQIIIWLQQLAWYGVMLMNHSLDCAKS